VAVTTLAVGAVAVLALAAAACGGDGGGGLSKEEYAAELNEICVETVKAAGRPSSLPEFVSQGPRLIAAFDEALPRAEALEPPEELEEDVELFLSQYKQLRDLVSKLIDAATQNDLTTVAQLAGRADALGKETSELARKLGAPDCASS
jgi:hypothetical protein